MTESNRYKKRYYGLVIFLLILTFGILLKDDYDKTCEISINHSTIVNMKNYEVLAKKTMEENEKLLKIKIIPNTSVDPVPNKPTDADTLEFNNSFAIYLLNQSIALSEKSRRSE